MRSRTITCTIAAVSTLAITIPACAATDSEITFRDVPWGSTYPEVQQSLSDFDWYTMSFDYMRHYTVEEIMTDDSNNDIEFNNSGINMTATPFTNKETDVAGYTTTDITLFFAYTDTEAICGANDDATTLYGAQYEFEPQDLYGMTTDLTEKLTSLYGDPDDTSSKTDLFGVKTTVTYWNGANDTEVALRSVDASGDTTNLYNDELYIAYVWKQGNQLLQDIDQKVSGNAANQEAQNYGNGNTNGL